MAPIIRQTCREYGIPYLVKPNIWQAIGGHLNLLMFMGQAAEHYH
jgi:hypothetical protein